MISAPDWQSLEHLYKHPLPSTRSGPLFNSFPYPTKISPEAIALFIASHTAPGETVLDTFAGSGTTGIAALLCDRPTAGMRATAAKLGIEPKWGPRRAILVEISVLGHFVSNVMCQPPNPQEFEQAVHQLIEQAESTVGQLYHVADPEGHRGTIRHVIWSDVLACPHCKHEITFWEAVVQQSPVQIHDKFTCRQCGQAVPAADAQRVMESVADPILGTTILQKKRLPVQVYGHTDKRNWQRPSTANDSIEQTLIAAALNPSSVPVVPVVWGELYRSGYHAGITHVHHFYTPRNLAVLSTLWQAINTFPTHLQDALRLVVLSYNASHSTLMSRVVVKDGTHDFVLTGAQSGVLYISSLPVEKNILLGLQRKAKTLQQAFSLMQGSSSKVEVFRQSSTHLPLPDCSVDYVFTDPPFGDYIPYAEINQINEAWLGTLTNRTEEIIISASQGKSVDQYAALMEQVLREISRVLKPQGKATLVFHSAKAAVWRALVQAYRNAGLQVIASSVLDKIQVSFKQVVASVAVKGDPLLLLIKQPAHLLATVDSASLQDKLPSPESLWIEAQQSLLPEEQTPERLFSRYITSCLELGADVLFDAQTFYERVRVLVEAQKKNNE